MKKIPAPLVLCVASGLALLFFAGCLTSKVADSGGVSALTASNTNVNAIIDAANSVFPQSGYSVGPVDYPNSISFDKPAGGFGKLMYGSYGVTTTIRVKMIMTPIGDSNDYRLSVKVTRVSDAGESGFEDSSRMMGLWAGEFKPLLRQIAAKSGGAGPM